MIDLLFLLAVIVLLVLINGFFVAAEFAIAAVPATRMAQLAASGSSPARRVLRILREPARMSGYLSTAQAGVTLASLGLGMYGEHAVAELIYEPIAHLGWIGEALSHTAATLLAVALLTYLHVVLGEMVPKTLALQAAESAALRLVGWMSAIENVLKPLTLMLSWLGDRVLRGLGIPIFDIHASLVTRQELEYIVEESSEKGMLKPAEQLYLENVIDFGERSVTQVMTPRTRLFALPVDATLDAVLDAVADARYSRYPVYEGDRDNVIGVLHAKDLARYLAQADTAASRQSTFDLRTLLREIITVPETMSLEKTLDLFRQRQVQIAAVIDEFGGTAGLVTLEDLAEEIVGEIRDEFDAEEVAPITFLDAEETDATVTARLRVRGDLLLDELNQLYELGVATDEVDTVGGLILTQLGRLARPGDNIDVAGEAFPINLQVESMDRLAIGTVLVSFTHAKTPTAEDKTEL